MWCNRLDRVRRGPSPQQLFQLTPLFFTDGQCRSTSKHIIIESRITLIVNN
jgi:hypothetical protein